MHVISSGIINNTGDNMMTLTVHRYIMYDETLHKMSPWIITIFHIFCICGVISPSTYLFLLGPNMV